MLFLFTRILCRHKLISTVIRNVSQHMYSLYSVLDLNSDFPDFYTSISVKGFFNVKNICVYLQEQFPRQRHYQLQ